MVSKNAKILVVDDDPMIGSCLKTYLAFLGYTPQVAPDGSEAVQWLRENPCDLIISDINMPFMNGIQLLHVARQLCPGAVFFIMTGVTGSDLIEEAIAAGAATVLTKPFSLDMLGRLVEEHLPATADSRLPGYSRTRENTPSSGHQNPSPALRPAVFC